MKLNLTIDSGNSSVKVSFFNGNEITRTERFKDFNADVLKHILCSNDIQAVISASVIDNDSEVENVINSCGVHYIKLTHDTALPISLGYKTPRTLGCDRIATAVGAWNEMPQRNSLIIDAGTAMTCDVVDSKGTFLGGNISPGLSMRLRSLNRQTSRLPLVEKEGEVPLIGYDTPTAIRSGVILGLAAEVEFYINRLSESMDNLNVFLTGGNCDFLKQFVKSRVTVDKDLLAKGLNRILLYNESI
jgi:type III pantothenate kinase